MVTRSGNVNSQWGSHDQPEVGWTRARVLTGSTCRGRFLDFRQDLRQVLPGVRRLVVWQQLVHPVEPFLWGGWLQFICKPAKDWMAGSQSVSQGGWGLGWGLGRGKNKDDGCGSSRVRGRAGGYAPWSATLGDWIVGCDSRTFRRSTQT